MGKVEILIDEEGALKVVRRDDLRVLLRRLRPEGFERHRVVTWPNCRCSHGSAKGDEFISCLMVFFLLTVILAVVNIIILESIFQSGSYSHSPLGWKGLIPPVMLAAVVAVVAFATMKSAGSPPPRTEKVQTVSALVQKV